MATSEGPQAVPSVKDEGPVPKPRVIPANQLVILREEELDCDLATAIQRVREDEATSASRILIVGDENSPSVESDGEELPLPQLPMSIGQVARCGGAQALTAAGERLTPKLESLECLVREAQHAVYELTEHAEADPSGRAGADHVRVLRDVLSWVQANTDDLGQELSGLREGFQIVDLGELLQEVQGQAESFFPRLRVNVVPGAPTCWGQASALTEALFLAVVITAHRIGGNGSVNLEADASGESTAIRIYGLGEPVEVQAPQQMRRLREIVIDQHRGRIVPDAMGPFGSGMVVELRRQA